MHVPRAHLATPLAALFYLYIYIQFTYHLSLIYRLRSGPRLRARILTPLPTALPFPLPAPVLRGHLHFGMHLNGTLPALCLRGLQIHFFFDI
jgi:hypothetical protein